MPQAGDLGPGNIRVRLLELLRQVVDMLPNVVQRRRDRPLDRPLIADFLWSDLLSLHIIQKFSVVSRIFSILC